MLTDMYSVRSAVDDSLILQATYRLDQAINVADESVLSGIPAIVFRDDCVAAYTPPARPTVRRMRRVV